MALGMDVVLRNSRLQKIIDLIDSGAGVGVLRIYDGSRPATGGAATNLLASLPVSKPCATISAGVLTFAAITTSSVVLTGTATWFRLVTSAGTFCYDGSISTSGSDLNLNSQGLSAGAQISISALTVTEANS